MLKPQARSDRRRLSTWDGGGGQAGGLLCACASAVVDFLTKLDFSFCVICHRTDFATCYGSGARVPRPLMFRTPIVVRDMFACFLFSAAPRRSPRTRLHNRKRRGVLPPAEDMFGSVLGTVRACHSPRFELRSEPRGSRPPLSPPSLPARTRGSPGRVCVGGRFQGQAARVHAGTR